MDKAKEDCCPYTESSESKSAIKGFYLINPQINETVPDITEWKIKNKTQRDKIKYTLDGLCETNLNEAKANEDNTDAFWDSFDDDHEFESSDKTPQKDVEITCLLDVISLDTFTLSDDDYIEPNSKPGISAIKENVEHAGGDNSLNISNQSLGAIPKNTRYQVKETDKGIYPNRKQYKYKNTTEEENMLEFLQITDDYDDDYYKNREHWAREKDNFEYETWAAFAADTFRSQPNFLKALHQYYIKYIYDKEFIQFLKYYVLPEEKRNFKVKFFDGQFFKVYSNYSIIHCVGEDFRNNGNDVSTYFSFLGCDEKLYRQVRKLGDLAILTLPPNHLYYLIVKSGYSSLTTLYYLWSSLVKLRKHVEINAIRLLVIPKIGGGVDFVLLPTFISMLEFVFHLTNVKIFITKCLQDLIEE